MNKRIKRKILKMVKETTYFKIATILIMIVLIFVLVYTVRIADLLTGNVVMTSDTLNENSNKTDPAVFVKVNLFLIFLVIITALFIFVRYLKITKH